MLMQWIDEVVHWRQNVIPTQNVTTASVDNLSFFFKGAYPGDSVVIIGQLDYVGRTWTLRWIAM